MDQAEKLRNIIKQQNQVSSSNARIITVTSGKGGVGKSSTAINIALQFRNRAKESLFLMRISDLPILKSCLELFLNIRLLTLCLKEGTLKI